MQQQHVRSLALEPGAQCAHPSEPAEKTFGDAVQARGVAERQYDRLAFVLRAGAGRGHGGVGRQDRQQGQGAVQRAFAARWLSNRVRYR